MPDIRLDIKHDDNLPWGAAELAGFLSEHNPAILPDPKHNYKVPQDEALAARQRWEMGGFLSLLPPLGEKSEQYILRARIIHRGFLETLVHVSDCERATEDLARVALNHELPDLILPHNTFVSMLDPHLGEDSHSTATYMVVPRHGTGQTFKKATTRPSHARHSTPNLPDASRLF